MVRGIKNMCSYRRLKLSVRESQQKYNDLYGNPDERPERIILRKNILGVFHLPRNTGNSGWDVNGTHVFGSFHWKISEINGTSVKVLLFSRWKLSDGNVCSIYNF